MTEADPTNPADTPAPRAGIAVKSLLGWALTLLLLGYGLWVHNGLGIPPNDNATEWWHATGHLLNSEMVGSWMVSEGENGERQLWTPGVIYLAVPAILGTIAVFFLTPSAVARALSLSVVVGCMVFAFYGLTPALRIWQFFHWRASAVFAYTALCLGWILASPLLARSWLRQRVWVMVLSYLPIFIAIVAVVRHATGTDEKLFFNFSPWPALPVIGLEIAGYTLIGLLFGVGIGLRGLSLMKEWPAAAAVGVVLGVALPAWWFAARFGGEATGALIFLSVASAIGIGVFGLTRAPDRWAELGARSIAILLGAAMAFAPLATGRAMATADYNENKHIRSQAIIDALAAYYEKTGEGYPDSLDVLVDDGYLDEIPRPRVGFPIFYAMFDWLRQKDFFYQSLGSSYVLEFTSTEWVQCAYNPPWEDEDEYMDDEEFEGEDEYEDEMGEAWSCPDKRPELW